MVLVRYMDNVMCAIAYTSYTEAYLGQCIFTLLKNTYPYPLDLQWEHRSNRYDFLDMEVITEDDRVWCRYKPKAKTTMEAEDRTFVRVPHGKDGHTTLDRYRYFRNTIIRGCYCCTHSRDVCAMVGGICGLGTCDQRVSYAKLSSQRPVKRDMQEKC